MQLELLHSRRRCAAHGKKYAVACHDGRYHVARVRSAVPMGMWTNNTARAPYTCSSTLAMGAYHCMDARDRLFLEVLELALQALHILLPFGRVHRVSLLTLELRTSAYPNFFLFFLSCELMELMEHKAAERRNDMLITSVIEGASGNICNESGFDRRDQNGLLGLVPPVRGDAARCSTSAPAQAQGEEPSRRRRVPGGRSTCSPLMLLRAAVMVACLPALVQGYRQNLNVSRVSEVAPWKKECLLVCLARSS